MSCFSDLKIFLSPFSVFQSAFEHRYLNEKSATKWLATPFSDEFGFSWLGQGPWKVWTAVENQREFRLDGFGTPSANWQVQAKVRKVQFIFLTLHSRQCLQKKSIITSSRRTFSYSRFHDSCPPCGRLKNSQNTQNSENGESQNSNDSQAVSFSMWCFSHMLFFFLNHGPHFLWVYRRAGGEWFASFLQHPVWLYHYGKPVENAFYCFYKTIVTSRNFVSVSRHNNP